MSHPTEWCECGQVCYVPDMTLTRKQSAAQFALHAHDGQFRVTGEAYITHPVAVAEYLFHAGASEDEVIAAFLHDTVEDTDVTIEQIEALFGPEVAHIVAAVTKVEGETYNQFIDRVIAAGPSAMAVKRADIHHNLSTLPPEKERLRTRYVTALVRLSD